jgi:hypothetical protein
MAADDTALASAVALSCLLLAMVPCAASADASPVPAASCAPFAAAVGTDVRRPSSRDFPVKLSLKLSSSSVIGDAPLTAYVVLHPVAGPVNLVVSRPPGARMISITDLGTGATLPTRPEHQELISMVRPERISDTCPLTIAVDVRSAYDLHPGTYKIRATFTPIVQTGPSHEMNVFPAVSSNDVTVTVMP